MLMYQLGLYVNENNVLQCRGRFKDSNLPETAKYPIPASSEGRLPYNICTTS